MDILPVTGLEPVASTKCVAYMVCALLHRAKHNHTLPWSVRRVLYLYIVGYLGLEVFSFDLLSPGKSSGLTCTTIQF